MRSTLEEEDELTVRPAAGQDHEQGRDRDREFTLSSTTLLGIFFGLVLICALFFAFGYTLGRRTPAETGQLAASSQGPQSNSDARPKPSPAAQSPIPPAASSVAPDAPQAAQAAPAAAAPTAAVTGAAADHPETTSAAQPDSQPVAAPVGAAAPAGGISVQVAAVSNPADADVLVNALHKRGYAVEIRHDPADALIHVQVGPFSARADAVAMRQKLLNDGYNAILK